MRRTRLAARKAHVTVVVLDGSVRRIAESFGPVSDLVASRGSAEEEEEDCYLSSSSSTIASHVLFVANKMDLVPPRDRSRLLLEAASDLSLSLNVPVSSVNLVPISCKTDEGVEKLFQALSQVCASRVSALADHPSADTLDGGLLLTRSRHRFHLSSAVSALSRFEELCLIDETMLGNKGANVEMGAEELRVAVMDIGRITGVVDVEEILDKLFKDFCIGK